MSTYNGPRIVCVGCNDPIDTIESPLCRQCQRLIENVTYDPRENSISSAHDDATASQPSPAEDHPAACECLTWVRTDARKTTHHPSCPEFKEHRFYRARMNGEGKGYVVGVGELVTVLDELGELQDGDSLVIDVVKMTSDEFEALPEFDGF